MFNRAPVFNRETEVEKGKREADHEVELYKRAQTLNIDRTIDEYRRSEFRKVEKTAVECRTQIAEYEHEFHSEKEEKGIELAKLEAKIEANKEIVAKIAEIPTLQAELAKYKALAEAKDLVITGKADTIKLLDDTVKVVVGKLSKVDVGSLALNVSTKEVKS